MESLTNQERLTTYISFGLIISILFVSIFLPPENISKWVLVGFGSILISVLMVYVFIFYPGKNLHRGRSRKLRFSRPDSSSFQPVIIRPSGKAKNTIIEGKCHFCRNLAIMGFTCSYCKNYFCSEHRLPEKHDCERIIRV